MASPKRIPAAKPQTAPVARPGPDARAIRPPAYGVGVVDRAPGPLALRPPAWAQRDPLADAQARVQAAARTGDPAALDAALSAKLRLERSLQRVEADQAAQEAAQEARQARQKAAWLAAHPDLSVPAYARAVMAELSPAERAGIRTSADYAWAIGNYETVKKIRATLGPVPATDLTPPRLDVRDPEVLAEQAETRAKFYADKAMLRRVYVARGVDPAQVDGLDEAEVKAMMWQFEEARRLADDPLANDALGDSKGAVNHFLDGCEHGLFKVAHDVGNLGLAAGFTYDAITGDALPEEPEWFGAAGRMRGHTPSLGELAWELAGNVPLIGQAQLLYGGTELVRGAFRGDWNNVAYGAGNMLGSLVFGQALGAAPLKRGKFGETAIGKAYESTRSFVMDEPAPPMFRSRVDPAKLLPSGEVAPHIDVPSHAPGAPYSGRLASGVDIEVTPRVVGGGDPVPPDLANRMLSAARSVDALLPGGRKIATPDGQPLKVVFDPAQPVPYIDRKTGTVYMNPALDQPAAFPKSGPGAEMGRWAPKPGTSASEVIMDHELGHGAMPEIGARLAELSGKKMVNAFMTMLKKRPVTEETKRADARLAHAEMLVNGLDELGADTIAVAAVGDLSAMPRSVSQGMAQVLAARAKDPSMPLPAEFPSDPVMWMRRRDFADGGTIPALGESVTPYDIFAGVRRHLGQRYGDALVGPEAPKVIEALMATNKDFLDAIAPDSAPLLDADYAAANQHFIERFDQHAARLGLRPRAK